MVLLEFDKIDHFFMNKDGMGMREFLCKQYPDDLFNELVSKKEFNDAPEEEIKDAVHDGIMAFVSKALERNTLEVRDTTLYSLCANILRNRIRPIRERRKRLILTEDFGNENVKDAVEAFVHESERQNNIELLDYILSKIDEGCKKLITERFLDGFGYPEIANNLDITKEYARKKVQLCMDKLRKKAFKIVNDDRF